MRISVEDLFVGVAAGDAADDDAQGHARTLDARVAMMSGRVNHDSVAPVHANTSTQQNQKYTAPDCSDSHPLLCLPHRLACGPFGILALALWAALLAEVARLHARRANLARSEIPCRYHSTLPNDPPPRWPP